MNYSEGEGRPPVPADIRRRVLVEAGHRCAIPTCRYIEVDIHHIIPWATCQAHEYDNLIALCPNCHRRADRGEIDRKSLTWLARALASFYAFAFPLWTRPFDGRPSFLASLGA
jgi:5-methylcytosine-specific restriction endonuclease McrA